MNIHPLAIVPTALALIFVGLFLGVYLARAYPLPSLKCPSRASSDVKTWAHMEDPLPPNAACWQGIDGRVCRLI